MSGMCRAVPFVAVAFVLGAITLMADTWAASQLKDLRAQYQLVRFPTMEVNPGGEVEPDVQDLLDAGAVLTGAQTAAFRAAEYWSRNGRPISWIGFLFSEVLLMSWIGRRMKQQAECGSDSLTVEPAMSR